VVVTAFTESLTTAAAVSNDGESTPETKTSLGVQAGTSSSSWEFGGVDWLARIRRGVNCFVTSVVTVDTIFSNRSAGNVGSAAAGKTEVVDFAVAFWPLF